MAKKHSLGNVVLAAGATVAAVAAGYFLAGPEGKKNRKKIRAWTVKAKGEVLEQLENLGEVSEKAYDDIVKSATKHYGNIAGATDAEVSTLNKELKKYWKDVKKEVSAGAKDTKKTVKKVVKKVKKQAKKATKKR